MHKLVTIVIPVYKNNPTREELASFVQCYKILGQYDVFVLTHKDVDLTTYICAVDKKVKCKYFDSEYFSSIKGYNTLMKMHDFYLAFKEYKYMLIYQLDAWVFSDTLLDWCDKDYDYIGAPWFEEFGSHEDGKQLWAVGNGGLSLRRVKRFIDITSPKKRYKNLKEVFCTEYIGLRSLPVCLLRWIGHRNTVKYYFENYQSMYEDSYFANELSHYSNMKLRIPQVEEALKFSFERSPRYLFELNNLQLPFGCHAWEKYDKIFWGEYIKIGE